MNLLGRIRAYLTRPKHSTTKPKTVKCKTDDIDYIRATHVVYHVRNKNTDGFFRECTKVKGKYETWDTNKMMATEAMANLLGLKDSVTHTEYAFLDIDGELKFGSYQEKAKGICIIDIPHETRRKMITPQFQCAINNMNLLDVICHECDHSPNNYNVIVDEQSRAIGIEAFDNNGVGTFSMNDTVSYTTYKGNSEFVSTDGFVNRPHVSRELSDRLDKLTFCRVNKALRKHLRLLPILFTWFRIKKIREAISRTKKIKPDFLIDDASWNEKTILEEISGEYGKTYLVAYIEDCCVPNCDLC